METTNPTKTPRDRETNTGRYTFSVERPCRCGHSLGEHTAAKVAGEQPCIAHADCDCECYKPARKGRS